MAVDLQDGPRDRGPDQAVVMLDPGTLEPRLGDRQLTAGDLDRLGERAAPDRLVALHQSVALPRELLDLAHLPLELVRGQRALLIEPAEALEVDVLVGQASLERLHIVVGLLDLLLAVSRLDLLELEPRGR